MTREQCVDLLKSMIAPERFSHTLGVERCALALAEIYGIDKRKAGRAALLHDCAKQCKYGLKAFCEKFELMDVYERFAQMEISLVHAPLGAVIAERLFGETERDILSAIEWHTTGRASMTTLEKIIYLSDAIEPNRGDNDELNAVRALSKTDLSQALLLAMNMSIKHVLIKDKPLDKYTIDARNSLLQSVMELV